MDQRRRLEVAADGDEVALGHLGRRREAPPGPLDGLGFVAQSTLGSMNLVIWSFGHLVISEQLPNRAMTR